MAANATATATATATNNANGPKAALFAGDDLWHPSWKESTGEATLRQRSKDNPDAELLLYSSWFCPFAQRAWIAAEESGVDYRWIEINPYAVDPSQPGGYTKKAMSIEAKKTVYPDFVVASPRGLVPAITDVRSGRHLWESLPVVEYIDAVYNGGKLMRASDNDPYQRAQMQIWAAHCNERVGKEYYRALVAQSKKAEQAAALQQFYKECRMLAQAMDKDGPYFLGTDFSYVDVALAPFWQRIMTVGKHYMGLDLSAIDEGREDFERLDRWWQATKERPSVKGTICSPERLNATYSDYSRGVATSDAAKNYIK